jgi:hypothetical protein
LERIKGGDKLNRLSRDEVIEVLKKALNDENVDARWAAVRILSDMGELAALQQAMQDAEAKIRKTAARAFADKMYLPGLALAVKDRDSEVSAVAQVVLKVKSESVGQYLRAVNFLADGLQNKQTRAFAAEQLRRISGLELKDSEPEWSHWVDETTRGIDRNALVEYFRGPTQTEPVAQKPFETVDIGMKFQANFPRVWYGNDYWDKPQIFPEDAEGPFRLQITTKLYVPADGNYRFYVKTDVPNRAIVTIGTPQGGKKEIISPGSDEKLQYVLQAGMGTHRIDFSESIPLRKGLVKLVVVYSGEEVRKIHNEHMVRISGVQKAGIQLFWSSDRHLMELVPAENLFH